MGPLPGPLPFLVPLLLPARVVVPLLGAVHHGRPGRRHTTRHGGRVCTCESERESERQRERARERGKKIKIQTAIASGGTNLAMLDK